MNSVGAACLVVVLIFLAMILVSCEESPYEYELRSRHPNGATNVYASYFDSSRCNQSRQSGVWNHPDVEWRCVRVPRT